MPLKMSQIVRRTPADRIEKARTTVKVSKVKFGTSRRTSFPTALAQVYSLDKVKGKTVRNKYVTKVELLPRERVRLSCSCPDFMYRWEYALWKRGSAELVYGNGEPPEDTNSGLVPGSCVAAGSLVNTHRGMKKIEDVRAGDYVQTLSGFSRVSKAGLTRRNSRTIKIQLQDSTILEVTPDHRVLTVCVGDAKPTWKRADEITTRHRVVNLNPVPVAIERQDLDQEALVLGYLVTEQAEYGYAPMEEVCAQEFALAHEAVSGVAYEASGSRSVLQAVDVEASLWKKLKVSPCHSKEKELPEYVLTQSIEYRMSLLYALFQGDGWISKNRNAATYATQSRKLAEQVVKLLNGAGISVTSITEQYSGACENKIFLLRLSRKGAFALSQCIPTPSKYGENYYSSDATRRSGTSPFGMPEIAASVNRYWKKLLLCRDYGGEIVTLREAASVLGVETGKLIANARRHKAKDLLKVHKPGVCKPLLALPKNEVWSLAVRTFPRKFALPALKSEWRTGRRERLLSWLDRLPPQLAKVKSFYTQLMRDEVNYPRVVSIEKGRADVYDLTVPEGEHFAANGVVVHNCKHVIALYHYLQDRHLVVENI